MLGDPRYAGVSNLITTTEGFVAALAAVVQCGRAVTVAPVRRTRPYSVLPYLAIGAVDALLFAAVLTGDDQLAVLIGAVTATASFRFGKYIERWFALSKCNVIIGKGGMSSDIYKKYFVPNEAIYLTTVGYGTGALLGRGIKKVAAVHWREELGLAQAIWVLDVENFGPFLVDSDLKGNSLFERENAKIAPGLDALYAGTRPATLRRFGETSDKTDELI